MLWPDLCIAHRGGQSHGNVPVPKFRLLLQALRRPSGTYTFVITRTDDPHWSEMGAAAFETPDDAAEAGRLAMERLNALHRVVQS
jgi:hypothetical protein